MLTNRNKSCSNVASKRGKQRIHGTMRKKIKVQTNEPIAYTALNTTSNATQSALTLPTLEAYYFASPISSISELLLIIKQQEAKEKLCA
jgi:hypothetical protein